MLQTILLNAEGSLGGEQCCAVLVHFDEVRCKSRTLDLCFFFQDVIRLTTVLPNLVSDYLVPLDAFNHLDYLWGIDADTLLYDEILLNLEKFKETI